MKERQLNEKESLELITRMIQNTQQNLEKGNGMPFLVWGYTTIAVSLLVWYLLSTTGDNRMNYLWFLIPAIAAPMMFVFLRKSDKGITTYIDRIIGYIWTVLGITAFIISVTTMVFGNLPILFITILLMGSGTAITGMVIRFTPITVAGFAGLALSLVCLFTPGINQILVFAAVFLVMMVIPGHILNTKGRR